MSYQAVENHLAMARNLIGTVTRSSCCERKIEVSFSSAPCTSASFFIFATMKNCTSWRAREPKTAGNAESANGNLAVKHSHGGNASQNRVVSALNG